MTHRELCLLAKSAADRCESCAAGWPAPQATAILCRSGAHYIIENDGHAPILAKMKRSGDTAVEAVVTYWKGENSSDIHCYDLRLALLDLDKGNADALVLLGNGAKRLGDCMPPER